MSAYDDPRNVDQAADDGWPGGSPGPEARSTGRPGEPAPDEEAQNRNPGLARPADDELFPGPDDMTVPGALDPEGKVNTGQYRSDSDFEYYPGGRPEHGVGGRIPDGRRDLGDEDPGRGQTEER
jgi:hypothetical protein